MDTISQGINFFLPSGCSINCYILFLQSFSHLREQVTLSLISNIHIKSLTHASDFIFNK